MAAEYRIGRFQVRPTERRVYEQGRPMPLGARAFDLLLALIEHRDRVVGKDELLALVWPALVVEEGNLAVQVSALRKLLGGDAIATIPGRGYRFTAPVVEALADAEPGRPETPEAEPAGPVLQQAAYDALMRKLRHPAGASAADAAGEAVAGYIPAAMTPLLGRDRALQETLQLLNETRCLTLTGTGGAGKTRLALALAEAARARFPGGVWWVELDRLSDPTTLASAVAHAVGATAAHKTPQQALAQHFKGRSALLVLDNCEHLVEACAEFAAQLLRELPQLRLLATSRESLRLAGEVAWTVPPLAVPAAAQAWRLEDLLQLASVQLLLQRIHQHDPRFALTQDSAASLAQICRGLEGLPLALELVAAQVGPQTLAQVVARLDRSLPLLSVGQRGGVRHHQTMAAAVDWGYKLLGEAEAALFLRLSVFAGGWTLEAAEALGAGLPPGDDDVPALLGRLHRVSMVQVQEVDGAQRFRMLEPIRQFAYARLEALHQSAPVKRQLLDWYALRCKSVVAQLTGPLQAQGYSFLTAEFDNLRALLAWSKPQALETGLRLATDLWRFWQVKGHAAEMLAWFEEALPQAAELPRQLQADARNAAGVMARTCGHYEAALHWHQGSLDLQRALGNRRGEAVALNNLCVAARDQYDHAAVEQHGRASLQIAREIGDRNLEGLGLMHLGAALRGQNRAEEAQATLEHSLLIFSELGERRAEGAVLNYLGNLALAAGRWSEAARCFDESLAINQALGDFWGLGISTCNQAALQLASGEVAAALPTLLQSFGHYRRAGAKHGVEECFELLAQIAHDQAHLERAAWCWGVVDQLEQDIGKVVPELHRPRREEALRRLQAKMPAEVFRAARAVGQHMSLDEALLAVWPDGGLR